MGFVPSARGFFYLFQCFAEESGSEAFLGFGHLFRRAGGKNLTALTSTLRTNVNDMVGKLDDI